MQETDQPLLDQLIGRITAMPPAQRAQFEAEIMRGTQGMKFVPNPGPQTAAWNSKADILLYGGEAGGGKSGLILGLALMAHKRSLILRRQYTDLSGLTEEAIKLNGTRQGYNGSIPPTLKTGDARLLEFGACARLGDEEAWMGRPHDLIGIDEAWQMLEHQVRFLMGWLRSTEKGQRCRVVLATNPPLSAEGEWLVKMFEAWLDPQHGNPAKQGELRWYVTTVEGKNYTDHEVEDARPRVMDTETQELRLATPAEIADTNFKGMLRPMSRTFIRASVNDNPFLRDTDYKKVLDSLPEPARSSVRDGNFMAGRKDDDWQVIPSAWVRAAQKRWTPTVPQGVPMCSIGVDCTGGGSDENIFAPRYDGYYPELTAVPGKETPNGDGISGHIIKLRTDDAEIGIDMGGGFGNLPYKELKNNNILAKPYKGAEGSTKRTADNLYGFMNKRSETVWRFREALDPSQPGGSTIALPPDPKLFADLCAPRYTLTTKGGKTCVEVEPKEDVVARLGRSPDRGDAVQIALITGPTVANFAGGWKGRSSRSKSVTVNVGHSQQRRR